MTQVDKTYNSPSTNTKQGFISRIGSRLVRIVAIIFSPITYLFQKIYSFFFGSKDKAKAALIVTEIKAKFDTEIDKLESCQEAEITKEMIEQGLVLKISIEQKNLPNTNVIYSLYENKRQETIKLDPTENGGIKVIKQTHDLDRPQTTTEKIITNEDIEKGETVSLEFDKTNIYQAKKIIISTQKEKTQYIFQKDPETNNVKITKEITDLVIEKNRMDILEKEHVEALDKIYKGQEGTLTEEMIKSDLGFYFCINKDMFINITDIKCIYENKEESLKVQRQENGDTKLISTVTYSSGSETMEQLISNKELNSRQNTIYMPFDSKNIYQTKALIIDEKNLRSIYHFKQDKDTNSVRIRREVNNIVNQ